MHHIEFHQSEIFFLVGFWFVWIALVFKGFKEAWSCRHRWKQATELLHPNKTCPCTKLSEAWLSYSKVGGLQQWGLLSMLRGRWLLCWEVAFLGWTCISPLSSPVIKVIKSHIWVLTSEMQDPPISSTNTLQMLHPLYSHQVHTAPMLICTLAWVRAKQLQLEVENPQ